MVKMTDGARSAEEGIPPVKLMEPRADSYEVEDMVVILLELGWEV
jgi:hypothetical protein